MTQREFLDGIADAHGTFIKKQCNGDFFLIDIVTNVLVMRGSLDDVDQYFHDLEMSE